MMNTADKQKTYTKLMEEAKEALKMSYSPYTKFAVGAAILAKDGRIIRGCNVESAAYNCGCCAEKTAVVKAVSEGIREFQAIAVAAAVTKLCWPCGECRQTISEFGLETDIVVEAENGNINVINLKDLLPKNYGPKEYFGQS